MAPFGNQDLKSAIPSSPLGTTFPTITPTTPIGVGEAMGTCGSPGVRLVVLTPGLKGPRLEVAERDCWPRPQFLPPESAFPSLRERLPLSLPLPRPHLGFFGLQVSLPTTRSPRRKSRAEVP